MLQNVTAKSINLYLNTNEIDSSFRQDFNNLIENNKGKTEMYLTLLSDYDNTSIKLVSRSKTIDINNEEIERFIDTYSNVVKKVVIKQ